MARGRKESCNASAPIRVLLADDHVIVTSALSRLLDALPDITVVAVAANGALTLQATREHAPDLVVLDLDMPGTVPTDLVTELLALPSPPEVLVLTGLDDAVYRQALVRAGVGGYLRKGVTPQVLIDAIRTLARSRSVRLGHRPGAGAPPVAAPCIEQLSAREREVLRLLVLGHSYREIADTLDISTSSVGTYRTRLCDKLGVHSRTELVRLALAGGMHEYPAPPSPD